jgi:hypothetical protein
MLKELHAAFYYLVYYSMIYIFPVAFVFFLVFTVALKELDTKLRFREIMQSIFKKLF